MNFTKSSPECVLSKTFVCNFDENENKTDVLDFCRFHHETFNVQTCCPSEFICIDVQTNKKVMLNGIALASTIGWPAGELCMGIEAMGKFKLQLAKKLDFSTKKRTPRCFMNLRNIILEPNKTYRMKIFVSKEVSYYTSSSGSNVFRYNDLEVFFRVHSEHDIISHFYFSEF